MSDQTASASSDCEAKRAEIEARQKEFDGLWLEMSSGNTARKIGVRKYIVTFAPSITGEQRELP